MVEEHVLDQLADYIFGSLDTADRGLVEEHLRRCDVCHSEWLALQEAAGQLAFAAPLVTPPARVRTTVMRRARPLASWLKYRRPVWRGLARKWFQPISPGWGIVSLVMILALATGSLLMWRQVQQLTSPAQAQMRTVALVSDPSVPDATGVLVITASGRYGTLVVDKLPTLDAQHQYQLWLTNGGQRTNGGVFSVDPEGYAAMVIDSPLPLTNYHNFGITVEPFGGSPGPTGARVLSGNL